MTLARFFQRTCLALAALGFAALLHTVIHADRALLGHGLFALLPAGFVMVLLVRIARQDARLSRNTD